MEDKRRVDREASRPVGARGTRPAAVGRREFLRTALLAAAGLAFAAHARPRTAFAYQGYRATDPRAPVQRFAFAQLSYHGGNWDPYPAAVTQLLAELERVTSVEALPTRIDLTLDAPDLFSYPFLYLTGRDDFVPFTTFQIERLRTWLGGGGTLLADDAAATPGYGFEAAVRREISRVFPGERLERLPAEHTVFKSFFLIRGMGGRQVVNPFLEGITIQGRTAVICSQNDLAGAWVRDALGRWLNPCVPGGERQRRLAFQLGVNIIMYALCADYKQDRIHVPFLRQRI